MLGIDCQRDSLAARRQVGYLPGDLPIYPDLVARATTSTTCRGSTTVRSTAAYLAQLLARFDVSDIDQRRPLRDQSHGMKQKIGIIQALMARPPVVILDEPTAGLDPMMVQAFRETLADLKRDGRTTVFLSSHVLAEVESTCDRIGLMRGGRMVTTSTIEEISSAATRRVTVTFAGGQPPGVTLTRVQDPSCTARAAVASSRGRRCTTSTSSRSGSRTTSRSSTTESGDDALLLRSLAGRASC